MRVGCLLLLLSLAACDSSRGLLLYCGAGLRLPAADLAQRFRAHHDVELEVDYGGSEVLLSRLKLSGKGDLYMPGDAHYVEQARALGLVRSSVDVARFVPVIMVAKGNPKRIERLADLTRPDLRVGLGDAEACAVGRKSASILDRAGLEVEPVFTSLTVNELGLHIDAGKLDAAIVWDATAAQYDAEAVAIPVEQNVISTVPMAVLTSSVDPALAGQLAILATSPDGQRIFRRHNFSAVEP